MNETIVLTDPPELVELKREFRKLDEQEQQLKPTSRAGQITAAAATLLAGVRARKAEISAECFRLGLRDGRKLAGGAGNSGEAPAGVVGEGVNNCTRGACVPQ